MSRQIKSGGRDPKGRRVPWGARWRRVGAWLALLAMLGASGTHWVALQAVAFGSMMVRYAQEGPWRQALAATFDGEHPCALCRAVQQGRQEQQERGPTLAFESSPDLAPPVAALRFWPPHVSAATRPMPPSAAWPARPEPPPKPPPRPRRIT